MRMVLPPLLVGLSATSWSQTPDFRINVELRPTFRNQVNERASLRWYDHKGRASNVSLTLVLEPGLVARIVQRFQRVSTDADPELLEEYLVEDPGRWRIGKQLLPFGTQTLLREYGRGGSYRTNLLFEDLPIEIAAADNGPGRLRGTFLRVGGRLGLSAALGNHIGLAGTSLTIMRSPEQTPGKGRGWRQAYGADYSQSFGIWQVTGEVLLLRGGETSQDRRADISVIRFGSDVTSRLYLSLAASRDWAAQTNAVLLEVTFSMDVSTKVSGFWRVGPGVQREVGAGLTVRL